MFVSRRRRLSRPNVALVPAGSNTTTDPFLSLPRRSGSALRSAHVWCLSEMPPRVPAAVVVPLRGGQPGRIALFPTASPRTSSSGCGGGSFWPRPVRTTTTTTSSFCRRTFFASSTDHTALLREAQVHRLEPAVPTTGGGGPPRLVQYVLAGHGMDRETVRRVPQLHLARLWVEDGWKIWGAKVVNRTLGGSEGVCPRLLEAALSDVAKAGTDTEAWATLHGLSDRVLLALPAEAGGDDGGGNSSSSSSSSATTTLRAIAKNKVDSTEGKEAWEARCVDFVEGKWSSEANLYLNHGGLFSRIEHNVDSTEYSDTCAGSMAVFRFSQ